MPRTRRQARSSGEGAAPAASGLITRRDYIWTKKISRWDRFVNDYNSERYAECRSTRAQLERSVARGCTICPRIIAFADQHHQRRYGRLLWTSVRLSERASPRDDWDLLPTSFYFLTIHNVEQPQVRQKFRLFVEGGGEKSEADHVQLGRDLVRGPGSMECGCEVKGSTSGDESLQQAQQWLERCFATHLACATGHAGFVPSRLLRIRGNSCGEGDASVQLVERMGTSFTQVTQYAALSHRWGLRTMDSATLRSNLRARKEVGLPHASLPRMTQDVVYVLRQLGVEYLWVDCFCILQDDVDDWKHEAVQMAAIYSNAVITIAVTWCHSSEQSLFSETPEHYSAAVLAQEGDQTVKISKFLPHFHRGPFHRPHAAENQPHHLVSWPLLSRRWVFQEQLLSHRILHFTQHEILWECNTTLRCQCGGVVSEWDCRCQNNNSPSVMPWMRAVGKPVKENVTNKRWAEIVQDYSKRDFTVGSDRLAALAGIVRAWGLSRNMTYLSGLWKENLSRRLCWYRLRCPDGQFVPVRPEPCPPTWSWVSTPSSVTYQKQVSDHSLLSSDAPVRSDRATDQYDIKIQVVDHRCHGDSSLGDLVDPRLFVSGYVVPATLFHGPHAASQPDENPRVSTKGKDLLEMISDCRLDRVIPPESDVICLRCHSQWTKNIDHLIEYWEMKAAHWLVLRRVRTAAGTDGRNTYERIGYLDTSERDALSWEKIMKRERPILV